MKYRPHKGCLAESMAEMVEVDGRAGLLIKFQRELCIYGIDVRDENIHIMPYGGDDDRIGWKNVHIIRVEGYGVLGFCEGDGA